MLRLTGWPTPPWRMGRTLNWGIHALLEKRVIFGPLLCSTILDMTMAVPGATSRCTSRSDGPKGLTTRHPLALVISSIATHTERYGVVFSPVAPSRLSLSRCQSNAPPRT